LETVVAGGSDLEVLSTCKFDDRPKHEYGEFLTENNRKKEPQNRNQQPQDFKGTKQQILAQNRILVKI